MSNWHRLLWIDKQIRERRYPNGPGIAEKFNISVRQASRDIEYLRDSLEAPVVYCPRRKGYRYEEASFQLPATTITAEQRLALRQLSTYFGMKPEEDQFGLGELFRRLERLAGDGAPSAALSLPDAGRRETERHMESAIQAAATAAVMPSSEPYYADIQFEAAGIAEAFRLDAVDLGNRTFRVRYDSVERLIGFLLSIPYPFRVLSPSWLGTMMKFRLEKKLRAMNR
ncbi:HTH domain-containing protein [Paenibacillus ginsengarvi]|uniref:HTH domain-containing protein n=1 Tax=Paenibacillus ginsengarvi TaxID=400777 RepID=A0A3B0CE42_9BACL|nr:HTH domain-containing protein [Paenibacillus ginsengarvi]RKN82037.1 hypothetical protein D7M11_18870 [Paenibacillus ginsengarvi]